MGEFSFLDEDVQTSIRVLARDVHSKHSTAVPAAVPSFVPWYACVSDAPKFFTRAARTIMIIGMMFFSCRKKINIRESEEINFDLRTTSWARLPQQINPNAWEYRSSETWSKGDEMERRHTEYGFSISNAMTYIMSQMRYRRLDSRLEKNQMGMRTASNARNTHNFDRGVVFPGKPNATVHDEGLLPAFPQYTPRWSSFYEANVLLCWK